MRKLANIIYRYIEQIWLHENAWQWAKKEGFPNMKERVLWKLSQGDSRANLLQLILGLFRPSTQASYLRAIIDEEIFTFAIAADLKCYYGAKAPPVLDDIVDTAYAVYNSEGRFDASGRWLMQPGVWSGHPDFMYASYAESRPGLEPKAIKDISADTSHSARLPMILTSLRDAASKEQRDLYSKILDGVNRQFFEVAVVKPSSSHPYYRTTNYMDGRNGLYRYGYKTMPQGMAPYELSGTITLGWWAFLRSPQSKEMYKYIAEHRLTDEAIKLYVGANTTRRRNPLVTQPDFYRNGFCELIAHLASRL